jgi:uncharacterized membrane protein/mono/diheme cytochrome c family protein
LGRTLLPLIALIVALLVTTSAGADAALATRGQQLMAAKGCFACHSTDGTVRSGPTLKGLWGRKRPVVSAGEPRDVIVDESYIARSLRDPDIEVAIGYSARVMPKFDVSDDEAHAITEAIRHPEAIDEVAVRRTGSLTPLIGSCAAFVLLHFFLSAIPVRRQLQLAIGEKGFSAVYSLIALASFAGMVVFYRTAPFVELWAPPRWMRWVPVLVMPLAILMLVAGFSTPSPTAVAGPKVATPIGIQAVTRHPALWGFSLWAIAHLIANGELHVVLVCASILVLALGGMLHIDARRKATLGAEWDAYAAKTSIVPFAAIAGGRARLVGAEVGLRRVLIAFVVYVAIFFAHPVVIGASPSP